jgi:hypothetical protein
MTVWDPATLPRTHQANRRDLGYLALSACTVGPNKYQLHLATSPSSSPEKAG